MSQAISRALVDLMRPPAADSPLARLLDDLPSRIASIDEQDRFRFANAAFLRWLGLEREQLDGLPASLGLARVLAPKALAAAADCRRRARDGEHVRVRAALDGTGEHQVEYLPAANGGCHCLITETMPAHLGDPVAGLRLRDEFIGNACHDLRTPITSMKLQLQMLNRAMARGREVAPERLRLVMEQSEQALNRLARQVEDMQDVSRGGAGQLPLSLEALELEPLIRQTVEHCGSQLAAAGLAPALQLAPALRVRADRARLEQALLALLSNAMRYAPGSGLRIALEQAEDTARLTVSDQGPGVDAADRERIFQPFQRLAEHEAIPGLGLGLFRVRRIMAAHEGRAWVERACGGGSRFVIELPLLEDSGQAGS